MQNINRFESMVKNSIFAIIEQIIYSSLSFLTRTVFIYTLGKLYLGFNGLFSDILTLLSLGELGVGTAITYSMYKPAAYGDYGKLMSLLNFYKKIYRIIGTTLTIIGLMLIPFLSLFISGIPNITELPLIYILFLLNTTASYFFVYKKSILIVNQKSYIVSLLFILVTVLQNVIQVIVLVCLSNYIIFLSIQLLGTVLNNILVSLYVDIHYGFLKEYKNERIDDETKNSIFINIKAMIASKVSSAIVTSTDNLLISKFVSTIILGIYSNYTLFIGMLRTTFVKIFESLIGSVGNIIVTESRDTIYDSFKKIWFVNFWLTGVSCSCLFCLIDSFIVLWAGEEYVLDIKIVVLICFNLYMRLIRSTFLMYIDTYGMFVEIRWKCIAEAIINLVASLILVVPLKMGVIGILLGTLISNFTTNFWYEPYLLYKRKFGKMWRDYLLTFTKYFLSIFGGTIINYLLLNKIILIGGWCGFFSKLFICLITINLFLCILYKQASEYTYFIDLIKQNVYKVLRR